MQKSAGKRNVPPPLHRQQLPVNERSGAHSLVAPVATNLSRLTGDLGVDLDSPSRDAVEAELVQLRATLLERDREIAQLKERLAQYEAAPRVPAAAVSPNSHDAKRVETIANVDAGEQSLAHETAGSNFADLDTPYPILQRVAFAYTSSSLPPASVLDSAPPSQRRSPRRSCELELEFTEDTHFYAGITQDISQGGVFVATYRLLPVGSRLDLSFDLPDGTEIKTRGEVKWLRESAYSSERPGMGVAFLGLSEDAIVAIHRFCSERPPLYMDI
jgi:uncharacterized protein (TIGR02266 family)